jgi:hypothetical protein
MVTYGCTAGCRLTFETENDWRHQENIWHFNLWKSGYWLCTEPRTDDPRYFCLHLCIARTEIKRLASEKHDVEYNDEYAEWHRLGDWAEDRYWCGWCLHIVEQQWRLGFNPWMERQNHLAAHF